MYNSTKKIWFIVGGATALLTGFSVATWAIIDQNNKIPRGDKIISHLRGYTEFSNVPFDATRMSIHDWIYANRPTKLLYEQVENSWSNYYIYLFSDDAEKTKNIEYKYDKDTSSGNISGSTTQQNVQFTLFNSPELLKEVSMQEASLLYARIRIETGNNYMNYHVESRDPKEKSIWYKLGSSFNTYSGETFTSTRVDSITTKYSINGNSGFVDKQESIKLTNTMNTWSQITSSVTSNTGASLFQYEFKQLSNVSTGKEETKPENITGINYTVTQKSGNNTLLSTFTEQTELKNRFGVVDVSLNKKYKIYNVTHSINSTNISEGKNYYSYWTPKSNNDYATFHLPNEVGLIGFFRKL